MCTTAPKLVETETRTQELLEVVVDGWDDPDPGAGAITLISCTPRL